MTKVAFIDSSLSNHSGRGIGFYSSRLFSSLQGLADELNLSLTSITDIAHSDFSDFDVVHVPFFNLFLPTPLPKSRKLVVTIHDVVPLEFPDHYPSGVKGLLQLTKNTLLLSRARYILTDSYVSAKSIHRYLNIPNSKLKVIYLAPSDTLFQKVDPPFLREIKSKYRLPDRFILYVGDINWNKNLPQLIKACLNLRTPLVLVGKNVKTIETVNLNHPELSHLLSIRSDLNSPLITRTGFLSDLELSAVYRLATLYCQPSLAEGFGLPVLEAMASGLPVVCSNSHSLPEIAGSAACYFDPYNLENMQTILKLVFANLGIRRRLSNLGLIRARKFSWTQTAIQTASVYTRDL